MRKLELSIDELEVATFEPGELDGQIGTVEAHNPPSGYASCDPNAATCDAAWTCLNSCVSCDISCWPFPCYSVGGPSFTCGCEA